jgi:hypothetical protein
MPGRSRGSGPQVKGISEEAEHAMAADFDDSKWQVVEAPRGMEAYSGA